MTRPSLAQLFEAPDGYIGDFGWLCGYSADALFMDMAAELFTGATTMRRAHDGRIVLAMMLDPGCPQVSPTDVPGLAHLPVNQPDELPFALMHAKVALLAFRRAETPTQWLLRLIVSTGNWTTETLEDSLDLAWCVEVASEHLDDPTEETQQACADIHAAGDFLAYLRKHFDNRLLRTTIHSNENEATRAHSQFDERVEACQTVSEGIPARFFDNRSHSLLEQLPGRISVQAGKVRRNLLVMGSGFYEGHGQPREMPKALRGIVSALKEAELLTYSATIRLIVNEDACQAVAASLPAIIDNGWTVHPPARPEALFGTGSRRSLHAKFLLGTNYKEAANRCTSAWLYLGSGNLTSPGFLNKAKRGVGNLEAGVVFSPGELVWAPQGQMPAVTALLPVQCDISLTSSKSVQAGDDMPDRPEAFSAAPVAWFQASKSDDAVWLSSPDASDEPFEVLQPNGEHCERVGKRLRWPGDLPRQVRVQWDAGRREALVPVQDEYGRLAALPLASLSLDEVGRLLAAFPAALADDDDDEAVIDGGGDTPLDGPNVAAGAGSYAIRRMVTQIEHIARKQTSLAEADWGAWCRRLEQALSQASASEDVATFQRLSLNPLSPLYAAPFRPVYAETAESSAGRQYEEALGRVAKVWQVADLTPMGETA